MAETCFRARIAHAALAYAAIVPDLRGSLTRHRDNAIVDRESFGQTLLSKEQLGEIGKRGKLIRAPLQHIPVAAFSPIGMPGGVELHAEVDQQPRMAGKELKRMLEGGDGAGAQAALGEGVTSVEQRFGVARVGCVSKRSFEQGVGVADPPFDKRASRVVQQRLRVARDSCRPGESVALSFTQTGIFVAHPSLPAESA